jgi:hypothetical protein
MVVLTLLVGIGIGWLIFSPSSTNTRQAIKHQKPTRPLTSPNEQAIAKFKKEDSYLFYVFCGVNILLLACLIVAARVYFGPTFQYASLTKSDTIFADGSDTTSTFVYVFTPAFFLVFLEHLWITCIELMLIRNDQDAHDAAANLILKNKWYWLYFM